MSEPLYDVVFQGELMAGADPVRTRENLRRLFQIDDTRLAALFSGRRVVIKQHLDTATAERYRTTLAQAGALVRLESVTPTAPTAPTAEPPSRAVFTAQPTTHALNRAARDPVAAAFLHVQAPNFGLAPVGSDLHADQGARPSIEVDTDHLSLAPAGADLGQLPGPAPVQVPDTHHLKLIEP